MHLQANKIIDSNKITQDPKNEWFVKKAHSISEHEGMQKCLKTKYRSETLYFHSHWNAGVDCHCENQVSSKENGEDGEEDSDLSQSQTLKMRAKKVSSTTTTKSTPQQIFKNFRTSPKAIPTMSRLLKLC